MTRDFDHEDGFIQPCPDCELLEAYRDQWKKTSVRLIDQNYNLEKDRDKWKRLFIEMYSQGAGVTDEMMWAYRKEMGKA